MKKMLVALVVALMMCVGVAAGCSSGGGQGQSASLNIPDEVYAAAGDVSLDDGTYSMEIAFSGGSGKASIASPVTVSVKGGKAAAEVVWSSPNYDYMIVDGVKYTQVNTDGENSVFQIPVMALDSPVKVVGDTTAMSTPHEIDYEVTFNSSTATPL